MGKERRAAKLPKAKAKKSTSKNLEAKVEKMEEKAQNNPKPGGSIHSMLAIIDLECPVYLEIPRKVHALQCSQGHMICETCFKRLMRGKDESAKRCPNCRESYKKEIPRCLIAEQLIAAASIKNNA